MATMPVKRANVLSMFFLPFPWYDKVWWMNLSHEKSTPGVESLIPGVLSRVSLSSPQEGSFGSSMPPGSRLIGSLLVKAAAIRDRVGAQSRYL
jgi:hypothetical protein